MTKVAIAATISVGDDIPYSGWGKIMGWLKHELVVRVSLAKA
jgi:hypothetical protein